jgi:hypothetical protein
MTLPTLAQARDYLADRALPIFAGLGVLALAVASWLTGLPILAGGLLAIGVYVISLGQLDLAPAARTDQCAAEHRVRCAILASRATRDEFLTRLDALDQRIAAVERKHLS